jgi:hypothetical protein
LKSKLQRKKGTIKDIIQKKIEDNEKELKKWKELLFMIVDESLDEKIEKLDTQVSSNHERSVDLVFLLFWTCSNYNSPNRKPIIRQPSKRLKKYWINQRILNQVRKRITTQMRRRKVKILN